MEVDMLLIEVSKDCFVAAIEAENVLNRFPLFFKPFLHRHVKSATSLVVVDEVKPLLN